MHVWKYWLSLCLGLTVKAYQRGPGLEQPEGHLLPLTISTGSTPPAAIWLDLPNLASVPPSSLEDLLGRGKHELDVPKSVCDRFWMPCDVLKGESRLARCSLTVPLSGGSSAKELHEQSHWACQNWPNSFQTSDSWEGLMGEWTSTSPVWENMT